MKRRNEWRTTEKKRVFFSLNHKKKTRNAAVPLLERRDVTIDGKPSETRSHWRRRSFKNAERKKTLGNQRKVGSVGWASIKKKKTR